MNNRESISQIIEEFTSAIPEHIDKMPAFCNNGVSRNEMEWKHICFAMAGEIERLRAKDALAGLVSTAQEKGLRY